MSSMRSMARRLSLILGGALVGLLAVGGSALADTVGGTGCTGQTQDFSPCKADFSVSGSVFVQVQLVLDVNPANGDLTDKSHQWQLDLGECGGEIRDSDGPRTFSCLVSPGLHTLILDRIPSDQGVIRVSS